MKKARSYGLLILALIGILTYSCKKDEIENTSEPELSLSEELASESDGKIVLGEKLSNPYSVENMRLALKSLKRKQQKEPKNYSSKTLNDDLDIQTTDYYVKFWVENDEQKNLLIADSLNLSIIPLDVEIEQEGDYFVDENTEIEKAQWLYTSVVKDYQFHPDVTYEKIEDLFLIEESGLEEEEGDEEEDETTTTTIAGKSGISKSFLYDLEDESLRITDNWEEPEKEQKAKNGITARRSKRRPQGYIKVRNTVTGVPDPVVGVKVKTRRWFKWAKGWTNSKGYYKVNRGYRRSVRYTVVFKNTRGFKIWPSTISISSARYRAGKHSKYGHNITFNTNSVGWRWSTVNNATVKYLNYCTRFGIGKPHRNLRIVANGKSGGGAAPMLRRTWGAVGFRTNSDLVSFLNKAAIFVPLNKLWLVARFVLPDVIIKANASQGTDGVFETTFHELGHASHFKKVGNGYWIKYINYIITYGNKNNPYGNGRGKNSGVCGVGEMWGFYIGARLAEEEFGTTRFYRPHPISGWIPAVAIRRVVNEADYTIQNIFSCLNRHVTTIPKLNAEFNSRVGKNIATVNKIFDDYGY
ncbi:hypothetical protein L0P88_17845 [Muricauda sp. SCSIO 64092]|uniref:hypothetical protein n=1 Tax=Allomuricauda sp. SCSIO 64092 TaxID=2908842 RepID=UPI001FF3B0D1|nr:hypothetical protein [Muricauda sp. SCSIO 64092]UOY05790.1 hypothetical protein L0P88_17845 [Muricauda sp. SCSIO 64092]